VNTEKSLSIIVNPAPKKSPYFTRRKIDVINSISWLLMDAFWMFALPKAGLFFALPAIMTGWFLFFRDRRRSALWTNVSTNCWITMNVLWMLSDSYPAHEFGFLTAAKVALFIGMICVAVEGFRSRNFVDPFGHYKRYKMLGEKKLRVID
jgi:hypothetical protein